MKKLLLGFLCALAMFSLVACSGDAPEEKETAGKNESNKEETEEATEAETEAPETEAPSKEAVEFEELVVVDNEECMIKITGLDEDNMWGYTVNVQVENKSDEKTYMFAVMNASVNGVESDPLFATEVTAGMKANEDITFLDPSLEENGIVEFTDIELSFRVYDSDDWMADAVAEETVHVYPYGEENATVFVREAKQEDNIVLDNEFVTAIVTGYEEDDIFGYTANLFLVNKTGTRVMFSVEDVSVNGFMADPFFATSVGAGKCAFADILWSDSIFEENEITKVEEIVLTIRAYNEEDFMAEDYANQTVTLNP